MESTDKDIWRNRLREELEGCKAPVLATLESSLDPCHCYASRENKSYDVGCWKPSR